jgi:hypothetical protein
MVDEGLVEVGIGGDLRTKIKIVRKHFLLIQHLRRIMRQDKYRVLSGESDEV